MISVFFYGLFMDKTLLENKGFHPIEPVRGYLDGYELRIGERATLVKSPRRRAYGVVMKLDQEELDELYGEPSVVDYRPEEVVIVTFEKETLLVVVYNLPIDKLAGQNKQYAQRLFQTARGNGLPQSYLKEIELFTR